MKTPLELMFLDALAKANASRRAAGLPPTEAPVRQLRDGTKAVGPPTYLVKVYFRPWHYADIITAMKKYEAATGKKISMNKIIETLIEDHIENVSVRPPKREARKPKPTGKGSSALAVISPIAPRRRFGHVMIGRQKRRAAG